MVIGGVSIQMNFASSPCLFGQNQGARNNIIIIIIYLLLLIIIIISLLVLTEPRCWAENSSANIQAKISQKYYDVVQMFPLGHSSLLAGEVANSSFPSCCL